MSSTYDPSPSEDPKENLEPVDYSHRARWFSLAAVVLPLLGGSLMLLVGPTSAFLQSHPSYLVFLVYLGFIFSYLVVRNSAQALEEGDEDFEILSKVFTVFPFMILFVILSGLCVWAGPWALFAILGLLPFSATSILTGNAVGCLTALVLRKKDKIREPRGRAMSMFRIVGLLSTIVSILILFGESNVL